MVKPPKHEYSDFMPRDIVTLDPPVSGYTTVEIMAICAWDVRTCTATVLVGFLDAKGNRISQPPPVWLAGFKLTLVKRIGAMSDNPYEKTFGSVTPAPAPPPEPVPEPPPERDVTDLTGIPDAYAATLGMGGTPPKAEPVPPGAGSEDSGVEWFNEDNEDGRADDDPPKEPDTEPPAAIGIDFATAATPEELEAMQALDAGTKDLIAQQGQTAAKEAAQALKDGAIKAKTKRAKEPKDPAAKTTRTQAREVNTVNTDGSINYDRFGSGTPVRVGTFFKSGNDAKLKSLLNKVRKGQAKFEEIPQISLDFVNNESEKWYVDYKFGEVTDPQHTSRFYVPPTE